WDDDPRLQTPWHNDAVCRPQCARRHRHRPQHAAPPAPGVHPLPQHRRGAGAGANGDPRRRRQLRDPQTSQGTKMAGPASPLDVSLHAYLGVLLNAVEGFFAKLTRRRLKRGVFRSVADLQAAINRFVEETNSDPKPFVWTADAKRFLAAVKRGKEKLESIH